MSRTLKLGVAAAVVALATAAIALAQGTKLSGSVGPGFVISLRDAQGNNVRQLAPGPYEIEVDDLGVEHNFHLMGPGVDQRTDVEGTGKATWQVMLQNGTYTFVCDPHALQMRGSFQVGDQPSPPPPPPPPPPPTPPPVGSTPSAPIGARLALNVGPGFTISLRTLGGKAVTRLRPGAYTFVVRDRSRFHNARLLGAGARRATTVSFTGSRTWRVTLRRGMLVVQCDPHRRSMRRTVRIA
jgi:plastocyanin